MGRGRRPETELTEIRGRIEALLLQGLRSPAIHRALTSRESPNPIEISERQVRSHMSAVRRSWLAEASKRTIQEDRAAAMAGLEDIKRVALQRSALNANSNAGVGYLNAAIKAEEQLARIGGWYAPQQTELSGSGGAAIAVTVADHPVDHLSPVEQARRFRRLADDAEAEAEVDAGMVVQGAPGQ
jgi:hypothetical protein